ncbi:MAG: hypothetical protein FWC10_02230 [Lentimicrobiaceae bacterium]|nr:hypothetical protein [Lentimicrobiaceae bacterium]
MQYRYFQVNLFKSSFLFSFFFLPLMIFAQNQKSGSWTIDSSTYQVDALSCHPNSFQLTGIDAEDYSFDWVTSTLRIFNKNVYGKTVFFTFRTFSINFSQKHQRKSTDLIFQKGSVYRPQVGISSANSWLAGEEGMPLYATGSIARGVTIGTNQDFVLNSAMNLQISGFLAKDLEIQANITDKNIPMQPEGNTRVIQDFNKIFIHLNYKNQWMIKGGDIDIVKPNGYFLVASRRLLGMEVIANNYVGKDSVYRLQNSAGGGVAKGKYIRQKLTVTNGLQGPYKLTGTDGQGNIVILSGSERIYMDNKLLSRGLDQDYVMDYNTGEITFTSRILVTSEKEFNVEYQYSDLAYSRYSLFSYNEFSSEKSPKLNLRVNFFHEQDMKNRSIQPQLSDSMMLFLSQLGNAPNAYFPKVDTSGFYPNEILYQRVDTLYNGESYSIYQYCIDSVQKLYRVGFSFIGYNKGNYVLSVNQANGRVFKWVAPQNGVPQGDYEPVILLAPPTLSQMGTIGADWFVKENTGFSTEFAFSNHDKNTFSQKNNAENVSFGYMLHFFHKNPIKSKKNAEKPWWFFSKVNGEYQHQNFQPVESYRAVEFYKDYNLQGDFSPQHSELMLSAEAGFMQEETGETSYKFNYYSRAKQLQAIRNELISNTKKKGFHFSTQTSLLLTHDTLQNTNYFRTFNLFSKTLKKMELGVYERFEYNRFQSAAAQELLPSSFRFNEVFIYVKNNDSIDYKYNIKLKHLLTDKPHQNRFSQDNYAYEAEVSFEITKLKNNTFRGTATFRNTHQRNSARQFFAENFFVGSVEYTGRFFKNALFLNTYYDVGSGLEQKKIFTYLKVSDGQGTHIWIDYNGNSIEELNEFEIASFQDQANYIKVWITSPEYINTYNNQFTQVIQLRPGNVWSNKKGLRKFLSRFSNAATLRIGQKNASKEMGKALNPFQFNLTDSALISSQVNFNNNLSFNQLSQYWGIDYIFRYTQNKNMLYYGMETSCLNMHQGSVRGKPHQNVTLKVDYIYSDKKNFSAFFSSRDYNIIHHDVTNSIRVQHKNNIFWSIFYTFQQKNNISGLERLKAHDAGAEFSYRITNRGNITAKVQYKYIDFKPVGNDNHTQSTVSYEMLEGLQNGNNILWNVGFQTNITEFLQLDLRYEGRSSEGAKTVHTGGLQLKAFF